MLILENTNIPHSGAIAMAQWVWMELIPQSFPDIPPQNNTDAKSSLLTIVNQKAVY
ncbi:MAG: hypothetical protein V7K64_04485 [Nostoc sp.]|uniref:hypothetical protein n=1 Tax=unclassified Nostoc TaxID=2593658 RepID=UPI0025D4494A|nr:hypothetical protein [Nostoc sp. JL34]